MTKLLRLFLVGVVLLLGPMLESGFSLGLEVIGNRPLSAANYGPWPGIMPLVNDSGRVYQRWVNGGEQFYFSGDISKLNAALAQFCQLKSDKLELVLVPGPGVTHSFNREQVFAYDWSLQITGGVAKWAIENELEGTQSMAKHPVLTVCVSGDTDLTKLVIAENLTVLGGKNPDEASLSAAETRAATDKIADFLAQRKNK